LGPKDDNPYSFVKEQKRTILQTNSYILLCQEEKRVCDINMGRFDKLIYLAYNLNAC